MGASSAAGSKIKTNNGLCICGLALLSGGNWNNAAIAGVWAANFNNYRTNTNTNVGFRCACYPSSKPLIRHSGSQGCAVLLMQTIPIRPFW